MWPDLRKEAGPALSYGCQWCHGATGIGLARLGLRGLINEEDRQSDIAAAVSAARQPQHLPTDDVCCGNFGRVELLLEAASIERNDALTAEAHALASNLVARSRLTGGFRYKTGTHRQNPSFFTGVAGIGYQLLRLAGKHPVPSILTWG